MSPENNFYNEENLERQSIAQDIRHNYGFIFSQITQLFEFYYPEQNKKAELPLTHQPQYGLRLP